MTARQKHYFFFFGGEAGFFFAWARSDPATDFCAGVLPGLRKILLASVASFLLVVIAFTPVT